MGTAGGAEAVCRLAVARFAPKQQVEWSTVRGSLLTGVTVEGVSISRLPSPLEHSRMTIARLSTNAYPLGSIRRLELTARDARLEHLPAMSPESVVDIQRVDLAWPFGLAGLRAIQNGRLKVPYSDPIQFSGVQTVGAVEFQLYSRTIDLHEILAAVAPQRAGALHGAVSEVRFAAQGPLNALRCSGDFRLDRLSRLSFSLSNVVVNYDLRVEGLPSASSLHGEVLLRGGTVAAQRTVVTLQQGKAMFTGDPLFPQFDVRGVSKVERTTIHIALLGTPDKPALHLTSNPPIPQDALLLMLATGKRWRGAEELLAQGEISSELATDFIDYFLFGGMGNRLARRFGISSLALTHDTASGMVGVQTTLADKVTVGVQVEPTTGAPTEAAPGPGRQKAVLPYKVGAEYQITEHTSVGIEGQRTVLDARPASGQTGAAEQTPTGPQTNDTVLLKLKRQF